MCGLRIAYLFMVSFSCSCWRFFKVQLSGDPVHQIKRERHNGVSRQIIDHGGLVHFSVA